MQHTNAVLFSKRSDDQRQLALLCSRAIVTLAALWEGAQWRNPWIAGEFKTSYFNPEKSAFLPEEIATDTGYQLSRFGGNQGIEVVGRQYELPEGQQAVSRWARKKPDISALCSGKKAAFVSFQEVGYDNRKFFAQGMALVAGLVASGYYGGIHCYSDCIDNKMYDNPESCTISISEDGLLGIRIRWGDEPLVGPLLDFCRAEKLTEEDGREEWEKERKTA